MAQIIAHAAGETLDLHRRRHVAYRPDHFRRLVRAQSESLTHPERAAPQGRWLSLPNPEPSLHRAWDMIASVHVADAAKLRTRVRLDTLN